MPLNKNAFIRYQYLDDLLSDRHHYYDIHDLTEKVNCLLYNDGFPEVSQRCIEKDINTLESAPFDAPIERVNKSGKRCIRYNRLSFSIFTRKMSDEERNMLCEVLNTIGQFDGLENFRWLDDFKARLKLEDRRKIIYFSNNPFLENSSILGTLFDYISNQVVIRLSYHTFSDRKTKSIVFHPYLLKQYNERWFLIGAESDSKHILLFAIDRIDKVAPIPEKKYLECPEDLTERYEDIVGVTRYEDRLIEHICFWVSDISVDYVITKPIHGSQILYKGNEEKILRNEYPNLMGGAFFSIDCIKNYELIRELCSYGKELLVLSPTSIKEEIKTSIQDMMDSYSMLK